MIIVKHTCDYVLIRHGDGTYTLSAADARQITHCPFCGVKLDDDGLRDAFHGRHVKRDDDEVIP